MADDPTVTPSPSQDGGATQTDAKGQPDADPRFAGKNADELKAIIKDQDSLIGRHGQRVGDLEREVQGLKELADQIRFSPGAGQQSQAREAPQPPKPEFDWTNPEPYVRDRAAEVARQELAKYDKYRQQQDQVRYYEEAKGNYYDGQKKALGGNPKLFEGIERDVADYMFTTFRAGAIDKDTLRNPDAWELIAKNIRLQRGEYDRIVPQKPHGMSPQPLDRPSSRPDSDADEDVVLDEEDREFMKKQGLTEKEAVEIIKGEVSAAKKGLRRERR